MKNIPTTNYVYGTTRLGHGAIPVEERVAICREAMDAGVWFHTSHTYDDALHVIRRAADEGGTIPPAIFKIGWDSVAQVREVIRQNLDPLGLDKMAIGQLCLGGSLAEEFRTGGACYEGFAEIKNEGLVERFVLECWPWTSHVPYGALTSGNAQRLVDGLIFYLNPLQRFVSNGVWDLIKEQNVPVIAMRTVSGGDVHEMARSERAPEYLRKRAQEVAPLFDLSGCASWPEFCVRYVFGFPFVQSTVGATSRPENLREFLIATENPQPLPNDIQQELEMMQRRWSDDHDRHAEPWSM